MAKRKRDKMCIRDRWQTFPNAKAAEEGSYEEYKANLRRNAQNCRITDEHRCV